MDNLETSNDYGDSFELLLPRHISLYMSRLIFTQLVVVFGGENIIFKWLIISWGFNYTDIGYVVRCYFFWNVLWKFYSAGLFNNLRRNRFYFHTTLLLVLWKLRMWILWAWKSRSNPIVLCCHYRMFNSEFKLIFFFCQVAVSLFV